MTDAAEKKIDKCRRQFDEAATSMQAAVTEAGLRAAVHVVATETGAKSEQAVRADVRAQGMARRILDASGHLVASVVRSTLADPFAPGAFDAAAYSIGKLLATAWRARGGVR
ncbi:hypothetical protein LRK24_10255 [Rhodanobacter denitrificans]|uniref:hypothetical protein n=1 Tax=Rhodanobacter denitrificans TaxID=666685 RepID=UPI000260FEDC|nr:hypothetical protein [Rhodanobacter denitrificans]EIM04122.1 hypothetical protein UUC_02840 [Rhodanobacter denitrificans]UJM88844.1 hypothetical protein LRK24_10255 [Rhodanobacter denitrificans]